MAHTTDYSAAPTSGALSRFWDFLCSLGEASSKARLAQTISEISDEELARRGTTRAELVRKVFVDY